MSPFFYFHGEKAVEGEGIQEFLHGQCDWFFYGQEKHTLTQESEILRHYKVAHGLAILPTPSVPFTFDKAIKYHNGVMPVQASAAAAPVAMTTKMTTTAASTGAAAPNVNGTAAAASAPANGGIAKNTTNLPSRFDPHTGRPLNPYVTPAAAPRPHQNLTPNCTPVLYLNSKETKVQLAR